MIRWGMAVIILGCAAFQGAPAADSAGRGAAKDDVSPSLLLARQLNNAFIEVADKVSPAVVVIKVAQRDQQLDLDESSPFWDMVPWEYRRRIQEEREQRRENKSKPSKPHSFNGQGSGVIIREDGYILTNFHVVEDADEIQVRLRDNRRFTATIRGSDPQSDVAVLKISATNLPTAKLGDSSAVRVGEFAVAIGAPFDFDYSVTFGHVSAKGRSHVIPAFGLYSQGAFMDQDFIQTDASINPGNSGGPLVNLYGEVIGINTLIRGMRTGIGFAVPSNLARDVSAKLITDGKFVRSWLGIGIRGLRENDEPEQTLQGVEDGVIVTDIRADGPARKSDLKPGDVITTVDGHRVATATQLRNEVRTKAAGKEIMLDVVRFDDKKRARNLKVKVAPEPWPEKLNQVASKSDKPGQTTPPDLGLKAQEITTELQKQFQFASTNGVVVTDVVRDSLASGKLKNGDVIVGVNHRPIKNFVEFEQALKSADPKRGVLLEVLQGDGTRSEVLRDGAE